MGLLSTWRHHLQNEANRRRIASLPSVAEVRRARDEAKRRADHDRRNVYTAVQAQSDMLRNSLIWLADARARGNADDITALEDQVRRYGGDPDPDA